GNEQNADRRTDGERRAQNDSVRPQRPCWWRWSRFHGPFLSPPALLRAVGTLGPRSRQGILGRRCRLKQGVLRQSNPLPNRSRTRLWSFRRQARGDPVQSEFETFCIRFVENGHELECGLVVVAERPAPATTQ